MRSLLTLVGAAAVTFAVVGWFLGWYKVHSTPGPDGHREVEIDFNGPKIKQDLQKGEEKVRSLTQGVAGTNAPAAPASPGKVTLSLPVPSNPAPPSNPPALEPVVITPLPIPVSTTAPEGNGKPWQYQPH